MTDAAPLRYGAVGCGRVFQRYHLPCATARPQLALAAVCDTDATRARQVVAGIRDVLVTSDLQRFLAEGRPDVVSVCTPNDAHARPVVAALDAGAAVLCEKPLAATVDEARRLVAAVGGRRAGVNLPYRFHDLLPALREAVPDGDCEVLMRFTTPGRQLWRPVSPWYDSRAHSGGGALIDLGIHAFDLLVNVFGDARVRACIVDRLDVEERAVVDLDLRRGQARLEIDRAGRTVDVRVEVYTSQGTTTLDLRRNQLGTPRGTYAGEGARIELAAIEAFLEAVTGAGGCIVPLDEALRLQELVDAAYSLASVQT